MKKKYIFVLSVFLASCITLDKPEQYITFNGKISSINGSSLDGVEIKADAMYSRYPIPVFIINCDYCKDVIERDTMIENNLAIDTLYLNSFRVNLYKSISDSLGYYQIIFKKKIYKNTYPRKGYPKYRYIRLVFKKEGFKTKIIPFIPECDSIFNELYNVKLEPFN